MIAWILLWLVAGLVALAIAIVAGLLVATLSIAAKAERLVPAVGSFVEIDGNRIHYVETGQGRPIVFVHGLGAQLHHFRHTLFDRFGAGYRLIALDRPGSGYSLRARGATGRLTEQAEILKRFIEELELEKPLLVGHSLGGAVALTLAVEHPDAVSGIALLAPLTRDVGVRETTGPLFIRSPLWRLVTAYTVAVPTSLRYARSTLEFIFAPQAVPADFMVNAGGWLGLRPAHFYASSTDVVAIGHDLGRIEKRYGEIKMPAGILFGTADSVLAVDIYGTPMQSRIDDLDYEVVDGLGHMPQFAEPDRVIAFIKRIAMRAFA